VDAVNGPVVILLAFLMAGLFTFAFLVGQGELDDILERWAQDRRDRQAMRRFERRRSMGGPRSLP
jgi:hypothetical protein